MKKIYLTKKQKKEFDKIVKFFLECVEPITDRDEKAMVTAKILSHLSCFARELTGELK